MLSNNKLKYVRSLHQRKYRQKYHNFLVEGEKMAGEVLKNSPESIELLLATSEWLGQNEKGILKVGAEKIEVADEELKKVSLLSAPNQVLMVVRQPDLEIDFEAVKKDFSLFLDDIRDPGNMGTILRIADWFGIQNVFCSPACVEVFNPKVVQSSMGAFLRVNAPSIDFFDLKNEIGETPIYGATLGGVSIFGNEFSRNSILVIGNESRGISEPILNELTQKIAIPRHEEGGAESLNAAVATGILCAFFRK